MCLPDPNEVKEMEREPFDISANDFRDWLQKQAPDKPVGVSNSGFSCPVACYLKGVYPDNEVCVGKHAMSVRGTLERTPSWVRDFIHRIDYRYPDSSVGEPVMKDEALKILQESANV